MGNKASKAQKRLGARRKSFAEDTGTQWYQTFRHKFHKPGSQNRNK